MKRQCDVCGNTHGFEDWWSLRYLDTKQTAVEGHRQCVEDFKAKYEASPPSKRGKNK